MEEQLDFRVFDEAGNWKLRFTGLAKGWTYSLTSMENQDRTVQAVADESGTARFLQEQLLKLFGNERPRNEGLGRYALRAEKNSMEAYAGEVYFEYALSYGPASVRTAAELGSMELEGEYVLMNDITLESEWQPIGPFSTSDGEIGAEGFSRGFRGTLDGNGKTISALASSGSANQALGLFGLLVCSGERTQVQDLTIMLATDPAEDTKVLEGASFVGALAGIAYQYSKSDEDTPPCVRNVLVKGTGGIASTGGSEKLEYLLEDALGNQQSRSLSVSSEAGGVLGILIGAKVQELTASIPVSSSSDSSSASSYAGGLVGYNDQGTISDSYGSGAVSSSSYSSSYAGGLWGVITREPSAAVMAPGLFPPPPPPSPPMRADWWGIMTREPSATVIAPEMFPPTPPTPPPMRADWWGVITREPSAAVMAPGLFPPPPPPPPMRADWWGSNDQGTISSSYGSGDVSSDSSSSSRYSYAGGLVGYNDQGTISSSYGSGDVSSSSPPPPPPPPTPSPPPMRADWWV